MSIESQDTYLTDQVLLSALGDGSSAQSTFSTIYVSSIEALNITAGFIESGQISTVYGEFDELSCSSFSSFFADIRDIGCSSISTLGIILDGNTLTSAGPNLYLNGIELATASSLSSIADWAIDPAISTVNMNNNFIENATGYTGIGTVSTGNLVANTASISSLVCSDISTTTLTVLSTLHVISTLSSVQIEAQSATFSSINGQTFPSNTSSVTNFAASTITVSSINGVAFPQPVISSFTNLDASSFTVSSINGAAFPQDTVSSFTNLEASSIIVSSINNLAYPPPNSDTSQWANFAAVSTVLLNNNKILDSNATILSDQGSTITQTATTSILSQNGLGGQVFITAEPGYAGLSGGNVTLTANGGSGVAGLYGAVNIVANPGSASGINSGGLVNITANTGVGLCNATSAVKINGGGVNSYAGVIPSFGSVFGYNFVYGSLGVSLCAGLPPSGFQVPGTVFISGTTGTSIYDTLYTTNIYPYWNGNQPPNNLLISGRTTIIGSASVILSNVNNMSMEGSGAITGVNTINGAAYPPSFTIPADITFSSVTVPALIDVSSINGAAYPPEFVVPEDITVSSISTLIINNVSTINGAAYPPPVPQDITVSSISTLIINDVSTINGVAYPPLVSVPADLVVSTLTVNPAGIISTPSIALGESAFVDFAGDTQLITKSLTVLNPSSLYGQIIVGELSQVSSINGGEVPGVPLEFVNGPGFHFNSLISTPNINTSSVISGDVATNLLQINEGTGGKAGIIINNGVVNPFYSFPIFFENYPGQPYSDVQGLLLGPTLPSTTSLIAERYTSSLGAASTLGSFAARAFHASLDNSTWASMTTDVGASTMVISPGITTSTINVSTINGVPYVSGVSPELSLSTLTINGGSILGTTQGIIMEINTNLPVLSQTLAFNTDNHSTVLQGYVAVRGRNQNIYDNGIQKVAVTIDCIAVSSLGAAAPVVMSDTYIVGPNINSQDTGNGHIGYERFLSSMYLESPGPVIISTLNVSTINTASFDASGNFVPNSTLTYSLGNPSTLWESLYIGPGTINIAGPLGSSTIGTIGTDENGIVYTGSGFATPFLNVGPEISTLGAIGGFHIYSELQPSTVSTFQLLAQQNNPAPPYGQFGPVYNLLVPRLVVIPLTVSTNPFTVVAVAGAYYPLQSSGGNDAIIFDVRNLIDGDSFSAKNVDVTDTRISIEFDNGAGASAADGQNARMYAPNYNPGVVTNSCYCVCYWSGTVLTVY